VRAGSRQCVTGGQKVAGIRRQGADRQESLTAGMGQIIAGSRSREQAVDRREKTPDRRQQAAGSR
jgi:hypothetical protein